MKSLLARDAKVTTAVEGSLDTPLHLAAEKGSPSIMKSLLDQKAPVTMVNAEGYLPISLAVLNKHDKAAALLIQHMEPSTSVYSSEQYIIWGRLGVLLNQYCMLHALSIQMHIVH